MKWFKNLKRWQKGGLIGLVIGVILGLYVFPFAGLIRYAAVFSIMIRAIHFIPAYVLWFGHLEPDPFMSIHSNYQYLGPIIVFYGGLGAIVGLIQRSGKLLEKFLIAIVLILFLILFYFASFMAALRFSPGEF